MDKYIKFKGFMNPKEPMKATSDTLKMLKNSGMKQGKDYDIVPLKLTKSNIEGINKKYMA